MSMSRSSAGAPGRSSRFLLGGTAGAVLLALAVLAVGWVRAGHRQDEWQHGGDRVRAQAEVIATRAAGYGEALVSVGAAHRPGPPRAGQVFVVHLNWTAPAKTHGSYEFLLLDRRLAPPKPLHAYEAWSHGRGTGPDWAGAYDVLSRHYPWLAATASRRTGDGWTDQTEALGLSAQPSGDGVLTYYLDKDQLPTTRPGRDLLLTMVSVDAAGQVRWAKQVTLAPAA